MCAEEQREQQTASCHFVPTVSSTQAKMWKCGSSSDRNSLFISLWKQVTQDDKVSCHPHAQEPLLLYIKKKKHDKKNTCSGRDSLNQPI